MDLVVVVDGSGSVYKSGFGKSKQFMLRLVDNLAIGEDEIRFGVLQYSNRVVVEFNMNVHKTKDSLRTAIEENLK